MPEIELTERFRQAYRLLPPEIQKKVLKTLRLLAENPRHPSLQTKPIQGAPGICEAVLPNDLSAFARRPFSAPRYRETR